MPLRGRTVPASRWSVDLSWQGGITSKNPRGWARALAWALARAARVLPSRAMRLRRWLGAAAVVGMGAVGAWGCVSEPLVSAGEARCRKVCEASKSCLTPAEARRVDCFGSCDDLEGLKRANDCYDEADAFYDCVEKKGACADLDALCAEQQDVFSDCLAEQCASDSEHEVCL